MECNPYYQNAKLVMNQQEMLSPLRRQTITLEQIPTPDNYQNTVQQKESDSDQEDQNVENNNDIYQQQTTKKLIKRNLCFSGNNQDQDSVIEENEIDSDGLSQFAKQQLLQIQNSQIGQSLLLKYNYKKEGNQQNQADPQPKTEEKQIDSLESIKIKIIASQRQQEELKEDQQNTEDNRNPQVDKEIKKYKQVFKKYTSQRVTISQESGEQEVSISIDESKAQISQKDKDVNQKDNLIEEEKQNQKNIEDPNFYS